MGFFKRNKEKIKKCCNASISILLCIIITPVISIAGMLVEFSRYQSTIDLLNELMDASTLSVLADYDTYLKDRFGLYAVSQESDIPDAYVSYFDDNTALLGGSISITDTTTASGALPLSEDAVLIQQVLDCAEMTDLVEFFLGDLQLETLLEKFDDLAGIGQIADTANKVAEAAEAIEDVITKANDLKSKVEAVVTAIGDIKGKVDSLVTSVTDLYNKITNDSFEIGEEDPIADFTTFVLSYLDAVEAIKSDYEELESAITGFPQKITDVGNALTALKGAIETAKDKLDISGDGGSGSSGDSDDSEESGDLFEVVLEAFETAIDEAYTEIETGLVSTIQGTVDGLKENLKNKIIDDFNLGAIIDSITITTVDGQTVVSVTDDGKQKIRDLLDMIADGDYSSAKSTIEGYIPTFENFNLDYLKGLIQGAIDDAEEALKQGASDAFSGGFTQLINALKGIFDMDVFYEREMCAYISTDYEMEGTKKSPLQTILDTISDAVDAAEDLVDAVADLNILELLKKIVELVETLTGLVDALVEYVQNVIDMINEVVGYFNGANEANFYEKMLLAAYMTHYLPDRTCAGQTTNTTDFSAGTSENTLGLVGESLTGFAFSDIPVESSGTAFYQTGLFSVLAALTSSGGDDSMFMGAELEYILGGTRSEIINQIFAFFNIYFIRLVLNIPTVFSDPEVNSMAAAANVFSWVVYLLVIIGEPLLDTILIVNTGRGVTPCVSLIKTDAYLSPTGILEFLSDLAIVCVGNQAVQDAFTQELDGLKNVEVDNKKPSTTKTVEFGLSYQMYLWLTILFTVTQDNMMLRFSDIVYLEAGEYYRRNGGTFDYNSTYTAVSSECSIKLESFLSFIDFADDSVLQKKFTRTRGY